MPKIGWRKVLRDGVDGKAVDVMLSANMTDVASGILHKLIAGASMCVPCMRLLACVHVCSIVVGCIVSLVFHLSITASELCRGLSLFCVLYHACIRAQDLICH